MPNLVFIMSDEARKDVVFHEKYPSVRTPNIDSLRGEAVSFHNCFANYPVCVPSRSSVITGRYPHQIGVLRNTHRLPAGERDLGHHGVREPRLHRGSRSDHRRVRRGR